MTTNNIKANNSENTEITFRNKFAGPLTDDNRTAIVAAVRKFCSYDSSYAIKVLWNLTCENWVDKTLGQLELSQELVGDNLISLRNELRYQYELRHPGFLDLDVPDSCRKAFEALKNRSDSIVANIIYGYCLNHVHLDLGTVQRSLELLSSDEERRYFGGIRNLSASLAYTEAKYLKNFHMEIHDFLKALYEHKCEQQDDTSFRNLPFAQLGDIVKEAGFQLVPNEAPSCEQEITHPIYGGATPATDVLSQQIESTPSTPCTETQEQADCVATGISIPVLPTSHEEAPANTQTEINADTGFATLSATQILRYQEHFSALLSSEAMASLCILRDSGFDLNEIIDKEGRIRSLLQASTDLIA